jgi:hypothetical protein
MNPYLEQPALWSSFHSRFIVALADAIEQTLSDEYYVEVETRTYLDDGLDAKERYLEVRDITTHDVITVLRLLPPENQHSGDSQNSYEKQRSAILSSDTHLVEIDLLRAGQPMPVLGSPSLGAYRILISRSSQRPSAELYSVELWQPLPEIPIPLKAVQEDVVISLQAVLEGVYDRARYASRIDYSQSPPLPALSELEQQWLASCLSEKPDSAV